jgi:3-phosphoglycerate kinase
MRYVDEFDLKGKRIFIRSDLNVPLDNSQNIMDDTRIIESLPTIKYCIEKGGIVIVASHLGRPKGRDERYSLKPVSKRLRELLGKDIIMGNDCIGKEIENIISNMKSGDIILLENLRFYEEEKKNDDEFSKRLSKLCDIYINDAFGTLHRAHSSTCGMAKFVPIIGAGFLVKKEIEYLERLMENPQKPFVIILGGAKVSDKLGVIENLFNNADIFLIGGGMAYTFLKAKGIKIGDSICEKEKLEEAKRILKMAEDRNKGFVLPIDHLIAKDKSENADYKIVKDIPDGWKGFDIGSETIKIFIREIKKAKTILWNGPLGLFEIDTFGKGTLSIGEAIASSQGTTIVGGGDTVAALSKYGLKDRITHVSTGGGATLEFLEGKNLPGILALEGK